MKQQNIRIAQFVGLLGCLLVITSCCLFRSPKDPNQIQDPPPTDRNYLACRVNGKPVVFKPAGTMIHPKSSYFSIKIDSINNKTLISLCLVGKNKEAFGQLVNIDLYQEFIVVGNLTKNNSPLFEKTKLLSAYYWIDDPLVFPSPSSDGFIQITDFDYEKSSEQITFGHISGIFEFSCDVVDPNTKNIRKCNITEGVFNVIRL